MIYLISSYIIIVIIYSIIKKNNPYESFKKGIIKGLKNVINMYSSLLVFLFAITCLINCGLIEYLKEHYHNSDFILILIQMLVKPLSNTSSYGIMMTIYEKTGVNSFTSILSTFIHSSFDTLFYIITIYMTVTKINKYHKASIYGLILLLINYLLIFIFCYLFFY